MDRQQRALERILQKLSAVRQVLSSAERAWLDRLVLGASDEVKGHALLRTEKSSRPQIRWDAQSASYVIANEMPARKTTRA